MATIYVKKSRYKIFLKKPRYATGGQETKYARTFQYTTNNPSRKTGIVAKKGNTLRYE